MSRIRTMQNAVSVALMSLSMFAGGCGLFGSGTSADKATPIKADAFFGGTPQPPRDLASASPAVTGEDRRREADASGALPSAVVGAATPESSLNSPRVPTAQKSEDPVATGISSAVRDVVKSVPGAEGAPTSQPANTPVTTNQANVGSQYLTLGAVVTTVSGTPIYADKVINSLSALLASEARQRDVDAYRAIAQREIQKQVSNMIRTELEFAAASKELDRNEKTFADNLTADWRQRQIREAGGSIELAKRKAQAEGIDFDEKLREQYRTFMVQIYYQKKIFPRVQIPADEIRKYYEQHLKTEFTEADAAQFRVIKITAKAMGSREAAIDKAQDIHARAARGDDFAKLASEINHDPALMKSGGRIGGADGWVQKGAFAVQPVEDAVWKLQPGQVTDVIDVGGNTFYVAKLENRRLGHVRQFENEDVQRQITETLRREQIAIRREQTQDQLLKEAVIDPYPPKLDSVIEMAMQKYPQWAAATSK